MKTTGQVLALMLPLPNRHPKMPEDSWCRSIATFQVVLKECVSQFEGMAVRFKSCARIRMADQSAQNHEEVRALKLTGLQWAKTEE